MQTTGTPYDKLLFRESSLQTAVLRSRMTALFFEHRPRIQILNPCLRLLLLNGPFDLEFPAVCRGGFG